MVNSPTSKWDTIGFDPQTGIDLETRQICPGTQQLILPRASGVGLGESHSLQGMLERNLLFRHGRVFGFPIVGMFGGKVGQDHPNIAHPRAVGTHRAQARLELPSCGPFVGIMDSQGWCDVLRQDKPWSPFAKQLFGREAAQVPQGLWQNILSP